jgi:hypothetical protein
MDERITIRDEYIKIETKYTFLGDPCITSLFFLCEFIPNKSQEPEKEETNIEWVKHFHSTNLMLPTKFPFLLSIHVINSWRIILLTTGIFISRKFFFLHATREKDKRIGLLHNFLGG